MPHYGDGLRSVSGNRSVDRSEDIPCSTVDKLRGRSRANAVTERTVLEPRQTRCEPSRTS